MNAQNAPIQTQTQVPINTLFQRIKSPLIFGTFGIIMLVLIVLVLVQIYGKIGKIGSSALNSSLKDTQTVFTIIAILFSAIALLVLFIPNYEMLKIFLGRFISIFILLVYLIGLILVFTYVSPTILNDYSFLFSPLSLLIGLFLFYKAFNSGSTDSIHNLLNFDVNLERVKYILLYFCFIVFILIFYVINPGNYVKTYFGPLLIITILLAVFGFLYLVTIMTLPSLSTASTAQQQPGFFKGLSTIGLYSGLLFVIFLIIVIVGILLYPGGFISNVGINTIKNPTTTKINIIIIQLILIFVLWVLFFGVLSFRNSSKNQNDEVIKTLTSYSGIAKQTFLILFGLVFSGILISWIITGANNLSDAKGVVAFVFNIIVILFVLFIVFKLITGGNYYERSPGYRLFINIVLYIPCILVTIIDKVGSIFGFSYAGIKTSDTLFNTVKNIKDSPPVYYTVLGSVLLCYLLYFWGIPRFQDNFSKQGGTIIVNNPVSTNTQNIIGSYDALNGITPSNIRGATQYEYQYAISFWIYIDANSPNTNASLTRYTSLLNYGGKPNVLYNASTNTLLITMNAKSTSDPDATSKEYDTNGNIIVYKADDVLLQKWNNVIINYSGGTVDIFYNGRLAKTTLDVIPIMQKDTLTIGENKGINGQICNINYFNTSLDIGQVYYLYNTVKNNNPPVPLHSEDTIIKNIASSVGIKDPTSFVTTIPINIDITPVSKLATDMNSQSLLNIIESSDPTIKTVNYISPKWFFKMNGDDYNGL